MNGTTLIEVLALSYRLGGRPAAERMLTIPEKTLTRRAQQNRDQPEELIEKGRDAVSALLDYVEEYANLDTD